MHNNIKKNFPKVSVIMNCFDGEKYLEESLQSLFKQTYSNWELIFWDNLSKDNSKKILGKFEDSRIKYFCAKKFSNLYEARNYAVRKSTGKYIFFLDTDDLWISGKIEKQVEFLENNSEYKIVYSNYYIKNEKNNMLRLNSKKKLPYGLITKKLLKKYSIGILTACVSQSIFKDNLFKKKYNIIGDFDFFINLSLSKKIGCIQAPLAIYRIHENNYSSKQIEKHISELSEWVKTNKYLEKEHKLSLYYQKIYIIKLKIKHFLKKIKIL
jgi:glycosyltransferase involved in cell wall biosynthesis